MTLKHFFEASKSVKNKIREITGMSRNGAKSEKCVFFLHVLFHIAAIFVEIDLKLFTHIYHLLPSNMLNVFCC